MPNIANDSYSNEKPINSGGVSPPAAGWYTFCVSGSETQKTRWAEENDGEDCMLILECTVVGGPESGKTVRWRANLINKSEKAEAIGVRQISGMWIACGLTGRPSVSEKMHGKKFKGFVIHREYMGKKVAEIVEWKKLDTKEEISFQVQRADDSMRQPGQDDEPEDEDPTIGEEPEAVVPTNPTQNVFARRNN